jgi:hypothetical protein
LPPARALEPGAVCENQRTRTNRSCLVCPGAGANGIRISAGPGVQSVAASLKEASLGIPLHRIIHSCLK